MVEQLIRNQQVRGSNPLAGSKYSSSLELAREIEAKIKSGLVAGEYYDRCKRMPSRDEV